MAGPGWSVRYATDVRDPAPGWTPGLYPYAIAHVTGYGAVPPVGQMEAAGWVRVAEVPGLVGLWVMKHAGAD